MVNDVTLMSHFSTNVLTHAGMTVMDECISVDMLGRNFIDTTAMPNACQFPHRGSSGTVLAFRTMCRRERRALWYPQPLI